MRGTPHVVAACALVLACACGTGDTRVDPGDLELRDLLGVAPETAGRWDADQRASALRVLDAALAADDRESLAIDLGNGDSVDAQIARSLAAHDADRFADGADALGLVHVTLAGTQLAGATRPAPTLRALADGKTVAPAMQLELTETWRALPQLSHQVLAALASDGGATAADTVIVAPAPRLTVIASYVASSPPRMLVNPVLLAAVDAHAERLTDATPRTGQSGPHADDGKQRIAPSVLAANGNPYSFYGTVGECAYAQRSRCTACVAANDCVPITSTSDGVAECNTLDADGGRGYFLLCINLSLAISSVDDCTADIRPNCARDNAAANSLSTLEANAVFLDDSQCGAGLDACLTKIYGEPENDYPGPGVDAGIGIAPPRETDVSCGESCDSDKSSNCELSPNCSCEGPSCGNSFSCDSSCSSSNNQSGCNDNCDSCSSDGDGGGGGDSGGGCGGDSGGGGGDSGGGCGGGDSSSSSSSSCGGGDCGSCGDSGCSGCSGSSSGGGSSSSSSGSSCGGGGGGGGGCQVAKRAPSPIFAVALSLSWALLPVPLAAFLRRRARRTAKASPPDGDATKEVQS